MCFSQDFQRLTGYTPYLWQERLYNLFLDHNIPSAVDIGTGMGKTSILPAWLQALAYHAKHGSLNGFPRRLIWVVDRRTVVDQVSGMAEKILHALQTPELQQFAEPLRKLAAVKHKHPVAVSTLRGQLADNGEWDMDPARPAILVGTVDMIGSRLLFGGYRTGYKRHPLHAGFVGQDSLIIHDEAHLVPAFQDMLEAIKKEQVKDARPIKTMMVGASLRGGSAGQAFRLDQNDLAQQAIQTRLRAPKQIRISPTENLYLSLKQEMARWASSGETIMVCLRSVKDVEAARKMVPKGCSAAILTGTLRGYERDRMVKDNPVFARFRPEPETVPQTGTCYLICTSAGELGIDLDARHMICDLSTWDSMLQRFGRANRRGLYLDTTITILDSTGAEKAAKEKAEKEGKKQKKGKKKVKGAISDLDRRKNTLAALKNLRVLPNGDFNGCLEALAEVTPGEDAFSAIPEILGLGPELLDSMACTTVQEPLFVRPALAPWLRGMDDRVPETTVAWRDEVERLTPEMLESQPIDEILEAWPLRTHELVRDEEHRVKGVLTTLAEKRPETIVWVIVRDEPSIRVKLTDVVEESLVGKTILLPPSAGGLTDGLLNGGGAPGTLDVSEKWLDADGNTIRFRLLGSEREDMTPVLTIPLGEGKEWNWYRIWNPQKPSKAETLAYHVGLTERMARALVQRLGIQEPEATAIILAARWHDLGKNREIWQLMLGNMDRTIILAKPGPKMKSLFRIHYRHELGSIAEVQSLPEFQALPIEVQDIVMHLIATHHGRARPHFPPEETFDGNYPDAMIQALANEVPFRFARLQDHYGRWGLAWLESILRAADILASRNEEVAP